MIKKEGEEEEEEAKERTNSTSPNLLTNKGQHLLIHME